MIFGGVFAIAGLGVLAFALPDAISRGDGEAQLAAGIVGLLFTGIGVGGAWLALRVRAAAERRASLREQHPDAPWLWKPEWASGRIKDDGKAGAAFFVVFALLWNLIAWPLVPMMVNQLAKGDRLVMVAALFPLIGIGLAVKATRALMRQRKFGTSTLVLQTLPGVVGGHLRGVVQTRTNLATPLCQASLVCVRRITTGSGEHRSTQESILFQEKLDIDGSQIRPGPIGSEIPLQFRIPFDCVSSNDEDPKGQVVWRVSLSAEVSGLDFAGRFEVPVFETEESSREIANAVDRNDLPEISLTAESETALPGSKVRVRRLPGDGVELYFGPSRNPGVAFGVTAFLGIWTGVVAVLLSVGAPLLFQVVFSAFDVLIMSFALWLWLGSSRVRATPGALEVRRAVLGIGRTRFAAADTIEKVSVGNDMQVGNELFYDLQAHPRRGRPFKLGGAMREKRTAEALAATLSKALRLRD